MNTMQKCERDNKRLQAP